MKIKTSEIKTSLWFAKHFFPCAKISRFTLFDLQKRKENKYFADEPLSIIKQNNNSEKKKKNTAASPTYKRTGKKNIVSKFKFLTSF